MQSRLKSLQTKYDGDEIAMQVIDGCFDEIAFYKQYPDYYGYLFLVISI